MRKLKYILLVVVLIGVGVLGTTSWYHFSDRSSGPSPAENSTQDGGTTAQNPSDSGSSNSSSGTMAAASGQVPYVDSEIGTALSTHDLVQKVGPAVVSITTETMTQGWFLQPVPQQGAGTGIIVSPDGYIVTNNHVVEGAQKVTVKLSDGKTYDATSIKSDPQTDLAVVQIDATDLPYLSFLNNSLEQLNPLDSVVAVGNALALSGGPTWTSGVVSNLGRSIEESDGTVLYRLIQTDAAINRGNSGGPLVNMAGQIVGINTAIASNAENIGFAISSDTAVPVVRSLIEKGKVAHPYLGVQARTVTSDVQQNNNLSVDKGALLAQIVSGGPADRAGLKVGDVIVGIAGQQIDTTNDLLQVLASHQVGDHVKVTYWRGQDQKETEVTLGEAPS